MTAPPHCTAPQTLLFGEPAAQLPPGMVYQENFLASGEELQLLALLDALPLAPMRYRQYTARREVLSFGASYNFAAGRLEAAPALPEALQPLRDRVAAWLGVPPEALAHVLVARYLPGTPLGWHRDVPDFEDVLGVSLGGKGLVRFRPYPPAPAARSGMLKLLVAPRSIYLLRGPARWEWQHSVAPVVALRYSITFRTARQRRSGATARPLSPPAAAP